MRLTWTTFVVLGGFCLALLLGVILAVPGFFGMLGAETGSRPGRLPAPCDTVAGGDELVESLHDVPSGITIDMPAGRWRAVAQPASDLSSGRTWEEEASGDLVRTEVVARFPGRPRIDHRLHGIAELERCQEPRGADSAWFATGYIVANGEFRVSIALVPLSDDRWLHVRADTRGNFDRQRTLLAAARTARVD